MDKTKLLLCFKIYITLSFRIAAATFKCNRLSVSNQKTATEIGRVMVHTYLHVWLVYYHPMDREVPQPINQKIPINPFPRAVCTTINSLCLQIMPTFSWYRNRLADGERMKGKLDYDHDVEVSEFRHVNSYVDHAVHVWSVVHTWLVPGRSGKQESPPFHGQKT
jgi:hypothetical protein